MNKLGYKFYPLEHKEWLVIMRSLTKSQIGVLMYLRTLDPYGNGVTVKASKIASDMGISKRSVNAAIVDLEAKGMIELPESYSIHANTEEQVRDRLKAELGGLSEVSTPAGRIDLLTDTEIIEVKRIDDWKGALGQILVYSGFYPDHKKRLHLFGSQKDMDKIPNIELSCLPFDVQVTFEALVEVEHGFTFWGSTAKRETSQYQGARQTQSGNGHD